jgi:hypothetical protein
LTTAWVVKAPRIRDTADPGPSMPAVRKRERERALRAPSAGAPRERPRVNPGRAT